MADVEDFPAYTLLTGSEIQAITPDICAILQSLMEGVLDACIRSQKVYFHLAMTTDPLAPVVGTLSNQVLDVVLRLGCCLDQRTEESDPRVAQLVEAVKAIRIHDVHSSQQPLIQ